MVKSIKKNEDDGIGYNQMPPKEIFAYNEVRSCSDLFRLYSVGVLDIQPEFQRNEVWDPPLQARFIDSLLKELPIPSMCFSYDKKKEKMRVIDGLQRMTSIIKFLGEKEWKLSDIKDIDPKIAGKTNLQIKKLYPAIYKNIENLSLPITLLRVDNDKATHNEYLFEIFHRLNTYGRKLNNQEIRNCIYSGKFNTFIKSLSEDKNLKILFNIKKKDVRLLRVELILRFFAFYDDYKEYNGILTKFLNDYMSKHRNDSDEIIREKETIFKESISLIVEKISNGKALNRLSNAFVEALYFGVSKNISYLKNVDNDAVKSYYNKLNNDDNFTEKNLSEGVMKKNKVSIRLNKALQIFSGK
jgi:hypothetical protein